MSQTEFQQKMASFTSIEQALDYFEIGFDSKFIDQNRVELVKRFNGYLILSKPDDWFSGRRALKNAYCKVQRSKLDRYTRSACREIGRASCRERVYAPV